MQAFRSTWSSSLFTAIFALEPHKGSPHAREPSAGLDAGAQRGAYTPRQMHERKAALANMHFLVFVCLRAHVVLDSAMLRSDADPRALASGALLDHRRDAFALFLEETERALESRHTFPWATLARLQAPKFLSDIVERLLGAVYLDSNGDMHAVRARATHMVQL
ncbi:hypothetical protein DFH11DRAFT_1732470 [Phellopilus nigrolimitatus]|nr:hypothetical protein DFH11DRAFT_1732470 [Phellopilus nigrolimitatus]